MIFFPNAKINIGLYITEKRSDGYHNLQSVFYPVGLTDILEIKEAGSGDTALTNSGIDIGIPYRQNICYQAYKQVKKRYDIPKIAIHLHKIIPFGSGLGGGSADAAFMLKALDKLYALNLKKSELQEIAGELGSDCPFFIDNVPAFVWEKGNRMEPIGLDLQGHYLVVVVPSIHISTREAYRKITPCNRQLSLKKLIQDTPIKEWHKSIINDFEPGLLEEHPGLKEIKDKLYDLGAVYASLSGSGSSMYGIFEEKPETGGIFSSSFVWTGML